MKKLIVAGAAIAAMAVPVTQATAGKPDHPVKAKDAAAKQCAAEKKADRAAFRAAYGKHAMRACIKGEVPEARDETRNAAKECKAARADDPAAFAEAWGNGKNAYGKCVSGTVRAENRADVSEFKNAAKECKAAKADDPDAFAVAWGNGKNAYGKCVSATARADDLES
ncbi:MAG: hypothetical protein KDB46_13170 [Solirubrobacterales bacterium]|nr:hypothetical protein [Solirubrobacterales bacterium]